MIICGPVDVVIVFSDENGITDIISHNISYTLIIDDIIDDIVIVNNCLFGPFKPSKGSCFCHSTISWQPK